MSYFKHEEVRRLIENCVSWVGDGVVHGPRGCIVLRALRSIRQEIDPRRTPTTLGIEAGFARDALRKMLPKLRFALLVYYTSDLTFELQARDKIGISRMEYHRRLVVAHPQFMERFEDERLGAAGRRAANEVAAQGFKIPNIRGY